MQIYFGTKLRFDVDINESLDPVQQILKHKGGGFKTYFGAKTLDPGLQILKYKEGGSQVSNLDLCGQVVKVGEGWVEQKL